jgi:hypothetical protein
LIHHYDHSWDRRSRHCRPAIAIPTDADRDVLDLSARIVSLRTEADRIEVTRAWPHDDEIERILCSEGTRRRVVDLSFIDP